MNCKSAQNHLSAYLDRELTGAEMLAVRSHLADCHVCRAEVESLRTLKRLLAATSVPEPSADLADRLCASVLSRHRLEPPPETARPIFGPSFRTGAIAFAGVAACSMALTYSLLSRAQPPRAVERATSADQDLSFDVQRDAVYATGLDATGGVPILLTPQNGGR